MPLSIVETDRSVNEKEETVSVEKIKHDEEHIVTVDKFLMQKESLRARDHHHMQEAEDDLTVGKGEFVCMGVSKERMEFSTLIKFKNCKK